MVILPARNNKRAEGITVEQYFALESAGKKAEIAAGLRNRFVNRYFQGSNLSAFSQVALTALVIEAFETFCSDPPPGHRRAFRTFFDREDWRERGLTGDLFRVTFRNPILHNGEIRDGWTLERGWREELVIGKSLSASRLHNDARATIEAHFYKVGQAEEPTKWAAARRGMRDMIWRSVHPSPPRVPEYEEIDAPLGAFVREFAGLEGMLAAFTSDLESREESWSEGIVGLTAAQLCKRALESIDNHRRLLGQDREDAIAIIGQIGDSIEFRNRVAHGWWGAPISLSDSGWWVGSRLRGESPRTLLIEKEELDIRRIEATQLSRNLLDLAARLRKAPPVASTSTVGPDG